MPSYACATDKGEVAHLGGSPGGARSWQPQRFSLRGRPSLLWSGPCLESLVGSGLARNPRVGCDKAKRGCASRVQASPGAPYGREEGGESDPPNLGADAPSERVSRFTSQFTVNPLLGGVALTTVIPGGKAIEPMRKPGRRICHRGGYPRETRLRQQQPEHCAGRNRCRHATLHRRPSVRPFRSVSLPSAPCSRACQLSSSACSRRWRDDARAWAPALAKA